MNRTFKHICAWLLAACMVLVIICFLPGCTVCDDPQQTLPPQAGTEDTSTKETEQDPRVEIRRLASTRLLGVLDSKMKALEYPAYYCSAYVQEETGELMILTTDVKALKEALVPLLADYETVSYSIEKCGASRNRLREAGGLIRDNVQVLYSQGIRVGAIAYPVDDCAVYVYIEDLTVEKEKTVRELVGSDSEFVKIYDVKEKDTLPDE